MTDHVQECLDPPFGRLPETPPSNGQAMDGQPRPGGRWWSPLCGFVSHMHRLNPRAQGVWLAMFRNSTGGPMWYVKIGNGYLRKITGMSKRTVNRALGELVDLGFVSVVGRGGRNAGVTKWRLIPQTKPSIHKVPE